MKKALSSLTLAFGKISPEKARLLLFTLVIVIFVLCAGAPGAMGGIGGGG
jgi:hypothetical protein